MKNVARCARCNKGFSNTEKILVKDGDVYHYKCWRRVNNGR